MNKTFTLTIHCDTSAFHPENMPEELATQVEIMGIKWSVSAQQGEAASTPMAKKQGSGN